MDTRIRKFFQRIFLTCFIIHVSTSLQSQDFEKEHLTLKNLKMKKNTWLDKYQIYFNSSVIKKKDLSGDVEGLLEIGSYFYEIERTQINSVINTKSAKSLYKALKKMLDLPKEQILLLGKNGRKRVNELFSKEIVIREISSKIKEILVD